MPARNICDWLRGSSSESREGGKDKGDGELHLDWKGWNGRLWLFWEIPLVLYTPAVLYPILNKEADSPHWQCTA